MSKNNGGPAFACGDGGHQEGMSLRDYFAAQALSGMVLAISLDPRPAQAVQGAAKDRGIAPSLQMARICFDYADAMIAARGKAGDA